jgi:hypothetical protein
MGKYKKLAFVIIASAAISACSSTGSGPRQVEGSVTKVDESVKTLSIYENAKSSYEEWLAKLNDAEPLKLYSKDLYKDTMEAWSDAVGVYEDFADDPAKATKDYSLFSSGTYAERFNEELGKVTAKYSKLLELKERADTILADSIDQMAYLEKLDAGKYYKDDFKRIKREYKDLFEYVADKDIADAQNKQAEFLHDAKKLEVKTVIRINITPLEKELKLLSKNGIKTHAPISFAKANAELALAKNTIKGSPRDEKLIQSSVDKVKFELAHTTNVSAESQRFKAISKNKYESMILEMENRILAISKAVDGSDFRDKPLRVQTKMIVERLNEMRRENDKAPLEAKIAQLQASLKHSDSIVTEYQAEIAKGKNQQQTSAQRIDLLQQQLKLNEEQISRLKQDIAKAQVEKAQAEVGEAKAEAEAAKTEAEAVKTEVEAVKAAAE